MKFFEENKSVLKATVIGALSMFMIWYIFVLSRSLMSSDSAFVVDYVEEMFKYKTLFPKTWVHANDFWIYTFIPIVAIFMKLGVGMFISRQISVFISVVLLFGIILLLYKTLKINKGVFTVIVLLLSGISAQFMFEMYGDATYGVIILYILIEFWLFIKYFQTSKIGYLIAFTLLLIFLCACSIRFPVHISAPLIVCLLYKVYDNKKIKKKYVTVFCAILIGTLVGYILHKYMGRVLLLNSYTDRTLIDTAGNFGVAIRDIIYDYLFVNGSTAQSVRSLQIEPLYSITASSPSIVFIFIRFIFAIFTIVVPIKLFKKFNNFTEEEKLTYVFVLAFCFILFFFLLIANMHFWYRYMTLMVFFLIFLQPMYYKYFVDEDERKKVVFFIATCLFSFSAVFLVLDSTFDFRTRKVKENYYDGLSRFLLEKDLHFGFTVRENADNIYYMLSEGDLRVARLGMACDAPYFWLCSTDWFKEDYYNGKVFFINNPGKGDIEFKAVQDKALEVYHYELFDIYVLENAKVLLDELETTTYRSVQDWESFHEKEQEKKKNKALKDLLN